MDNEYVSNFDGALTGWTDERFVTRQEVRDLAMFSLYVVNLAELDGWSYYGHSFKRGNPLSCLVVKADIDGVPHVVFTSARKYTLCVRIFLRKLEEGILEWREDKYRS